MSPLRVRTLGVVWGDPQKCQGGRRTGRPCPAGTAGINWFFGQTADKSGRIRFLPSSKRTTRGCCAFVMGTGTRWGWKSPSACAPTRRGRVTAPGLRWFQPLQQKSTARFRRRAQASKVLRWSGISTAN